MISCTKSLISISELTSELMLELTLELMLELTSELMLEVLFVWERKIFSNSFPVTPYVLPCLFLI